MLKLFGNELNFKKLLSSFNVEINEEGPKIITFN